MHRGQVKNSELKACLARYRQIKLSVTGRKSGKTISIPVWFVLKDEVLYLLPVKGSDAQWYKNVLKNPTIRIDARGAEAEFQAEPITESKTEKSVIEKFREKYGAADVKKYYSKFDVAGSQEGELGDGRVRPQPAEISSKRWVRPWAASCDPKVSEQ